MYMTNKDFASFLKEQAEVAIGDGHIGYGELMLLAAKVIETLLKELEDTYE